MRLIGYGRVKLYHHHICVLKILLFEFYSLDKVKHFATFWIRSNEHVSVANKPFAPCVFSQTYV